MRSILINPYNQTVTEQDVGGDIKDWYALLRANDPLFHSDMVELIRLGPGVDLWIDEEGALEDGRPVFQFEDGPAFAGVAFILGENDEGNNIDAPSFLTAELVRSKVIWTEMLTTGDFGPSSESVQDHPTLGPNTTVVRGGDTIYRKAAGYFVWCLEDDGETMTRATANRFVTRSDALAYLKTVATTRRPEIREAH